MYILNEDFSGTSGTTPPAGWNNVLVTGVAEDKWHFDNPGDRIFNYPITEPFAIFDADSVSANGQPEEVSLESPIFDASSSGFILLNFVHVFYPGTTGTAKIEAYDGDIWHDVITFSATGSDPAAEIVDLSAITGGITNARIRFTWSGNGSGYWAIDNIRIYASLPLDGGVVSLDSPNSPVVPGNQQVVITLGNFGYTTLTSARIDWSVDGVLQAPYSWNGSIGFGQTAGNIIIGSYNFQSPVEIRIWQSAPNGQSDMNPHNDTITVFLAPQLCGTYTIGGTDPDFDSFSLAARVLNLAGITCDVTFLVRDGTYYEQFELNNIQGSENHSITFQSENGDSTLAVLRLIPEALKYESMVYLDGAKNITFRQLGLITGSTLNSANNAVLVSGATNIAIDRCNIETRNEFDYGVRMEAGSNNIAVTRNRFKSNFSKAGAIFISDPATHDIEISENQVNGASELNFATVWIQNLSNHINITGNKLEGCFRSFYLNRVDNVTIRGNTINNSNEGIFIDQYCSMIEISGNRLTNMKSHPGATDPNNCIWIKNSTNTSIFNNFIHTTGSGTMSAVRIENSTACQFHFNSINIAGDDPQGKCKGLYLPGTNGIIARNNILNVKYSGVPVYLETSVAQLDLDRNDYICYDNTIGYYNGTRYDDLQDWADAVSMDEQSVSIIPFFSSDTDLSINQALLNNAGVPVSGIDKDIDGIVRNPVQPDLGAKEYDPCETDAGTNAVVSPVNPLNEGMSEVIVALQNQGNNALTAVTIHWSVNDVEQLPFLWTGTLTAGAGLEVPVGNYTFGSGQFYTIKAWTSSPNNIADCNNYNDTIYSRKLAVPLCGNYTIGGSNPDFSSISEAVSFLNLAGITCQVNFLIRTGTYYEQLVFGEIRGATEVHTVTFRSENGDSSQTIIKIPPGAAKEEPMMYLDGTSHLIFKELGLFTGTTAPTSYSNDAVLMEKARNIRFEGCNFEMRKESDMGIVMENDCRQVKVLNSKFESFNSKAGVITATGSLTREIEIRGNKVKGATEWLYPTIRIGDDVKLIDISENQFENCYKAIELVSSDSAVIRDNRITDCNYGIYIDNFCVQIEVSGNRLSNIKSHTNASNGTSAIQINNVTQPSIFNNYIHTTGNGPVTGISLNLQNSTLCNVDFNSINITSSDPQDKSKGFYLNISANTRLNARNNIFSITSSGTPVYINNNPAQILINHNNYYSQNQVIGYFNGNYYFDLASWTAATGMDQQSMAVIPFFSSVTDLSINQIMLNNAGITVEGITEDIDGIVRNPGQPDIGAKEYNPCVIDAGINNITNPVNPLTGGIENVSVILQNQGTSALTAVTINWSVNEAVQSPFSWSNNLASASNVEVQIGTFDFEPGLSYIVKVWTSSPNNTSDCNPKNDVFYSGELAGPLCGTYTIGGNDADFASISQAAAVLNTAGIACPVEFIVRDGTYYEKLIIREISGISEENTVTFRSESGQNNQAVIKIDPAAANFEPMILIDKAQYIHFQDLGLFTGSSSGSANNAIRLNGTKNIEFLNCYFDVRNASDFGILIQGGSQNIDVLDNRFECFHTSAGAINILDNQTQNINIEGNIISGASSLGNTLIKIGANTRKILFSGNQLDRSYRAISIAGVDSIRIEKNIIRNSYSGIYADNQCRNLTIYGNKLTNIKSYLNDPEGLSAIFIQNSVKVDLINNFIHSYGEGPAFGINLRDVTSGHIYYNSANITNSDPQGKSKAIYMRGCDSLIARNNIFNIKSTGTPIHIESEYSALNLDYNDYFNPAGIVGKIDAQVYSSIFLWGQTINGDANSKVVNPIFKSDTVSLPLQRSLNGSGIPLQGIIYDIDGKVRHNQAPDIGCTEFFVDFGVLEMISPTLDCFHPDVDSVKVYIRQFGDVPFENLKVAYQLDNGAIHIDNIPGPVMYDVIHTFGTTETISAPGDYTFRIWIIYSPVDDNYRNDTLIAKRYSKPPPVVTAGFDNVCTGWEVHFTGDATVEDPYFIAGYEWLFGDGDTSYIQNPVHAYEEPGTYDVILRAYSNAGCYTETTTRITIDTSFQALEMDFVLQDEICIGDGSGSLEILAGGGTPPYRYFINGSQVPESLIPNFAPGKYEIRLEDSRNCSMTDSIETYPIINLDPQIIATPDSGFVPLTIALDFTANDAASWTWYMPGNVTDTSKTTAITFLEFGYYDIVLEVNSGPPYYCIATDSIRIFADIIITIEPNSVFTPNNDGNNDFFEVKSSGIKELNVQIFNQWGNHVNEITEVEGKWDGTTEGGANATDGTYFYSLKARGVNNTDYERQGTVLLLRHGAAAYPNPVTEKVRIRTFEIMDSPVLVTVYSVFGELVYSQSLNDPMNMVVDLSLLGKGIYILKMNDGKRENYVRIIKN